MRMDGRTDTHDEVDSRFSQSAKALTILRSTHTVYSVCYGSQSNSGYFPIQNLLTGFHNRDCVYCAVRANSTTVKVFPLQVRYGPDGG